MNTRKHDIKYLHSIIVEALQDCIKEKDTKEYSIKFILDFLEDGQQLSYFGISDQEVVEHFYSEKVISDIYDYITERELHKNIDLLLFEAIRDSLNDVYDDIENFILKNYDSASSFITESEFNERIEQFLNDNDNTNQDKIDFVKMLVAKKEIGSIWSSYDGEPLYKRTDLNINGESFFRIDDFELTIRIFEIKE